MSSTTVRVSNTIRDKIRDISESHGVSIQDVIEKAINFYENKLFLEDLNNAYAKSKKNNDDDLWDSTLMDGLEDEEWDKSGKVIKKGSKNA
ncbi:MAG: hypothetical protein H7263_03240 [Candidatus Sericytochromatia bacterium]|nr:hypothetical protein [Candidatus Sericytochromatia bacterium]